MSFSFRVFSPSETLPNTVFFPEQVHGNRIVEIITGTESLASCDGIFTKNKLFLLGIKTADCAPIAVWDREKFGVFHVGWRGLVNDLCDKIIERFSVTASYFFIGPFLPTFQIQKDFCHDKIFEKFGSRFFSEKEGNILFDFQSALLFFFPNAVLDGRSTFETPELASWRRDHDVKRNVLIVGAQDLL